VVVNEGADVAYVTLLVLMMEDMELMFLAINVTSLSFSITTINQHGHFRQTLNLQLAMFV